MTISTQSRLAAACVFIAAALAVRAADPAAPPWLLGHAYKIPSEYTNQESGYFSIIEGKNGRLLHRRRQVRRGRLPPEFDPKAESFQMVLDVQKEIGTDTKGFAAQAKIHTRNNIGASGKVYVGSKQGYPDKTEKRDDYPGGYVFAYDPATGKTENFGMPLAHSGIISVMPDKARGVAYVSACSDDRPLDHSQFMILDLAKHSYRDLGDMGRLYPFIVLDEKGRAYHPAQGGLIARYDPKADKLEKLTATVDDKPLPQALAHDEAILNWDASPDRKTLFCVEMSTNGLYSFDLTAGDKVPGKRIGDLLPGAKATDCRAMCVGPSGRVWAAVTEQGRAGRGGAAPRRLQTGRRGAPRFRPRRRRQSRLHQVHRRRRQAAAVASHHAQGEGRHADAVAADGRLRGGRRHGLRHHHRAVHAAALRAG